MTCPYCSHSFALTWGRYLAAPLGKHLCPACGRRSKFKLSFRYSLFVVAAWLVVAALAILLRMFVFPISQGSSRELGYWVGVVLVGVLAIASVDRFVEERFRRLCRLSHEKDSA
jgi:hypothetical protein